MKMTRTRRIGLIVIGLAVVIVLAGLFPRNVQLSLKSGGFVDVRPASFWGSLVVSTCKIDYRTQGALAGRCLLYHTFLESPIIVMPMDDNKTLLCVYDFDVGLRLLKIHTSEKFQPFTPGSELGAIVCASSWKVEEGNRGDWQRAVEFLENMSVGDFDRQSVPGFDFGFYRIYREPAPLLEQMRRLASVPTKQTLTATQKRRAITD